MSSKQEHNAVFYKSLSNLEAAKDYFKQHLPKTLLDAVDLNSLELCSSSFFDAELNAKHTDVLYRFKLNAVNNHAYALYVLSEHQSTPLEIMPLRVLKYEVSIMNRHWESFGKIPLVHTIVYYNGKSPWSYSRDLLDIIDAPADLVAELALKPFQIVDLHLIPDAMLRLHVWAGAMGIIMKHIYDSDIMPTLIECMELLKQIQEFTGAADGLGFIAGLLSYVCQKGEIRDKEAFQSLIYTHLTEEVGDTIMTLAEQYIQQGMQQGMQKGIQEGIETGIQAGINQAELRIAKKLLATGLTMEQIAAMTGVRLAVLDNLKNETALSD